MKSKKKLKHRYSGDKSTKFWDVVNSIENEADKQELYSLGVVLQNLESYVLRQLYNATGDSTDNPFSNLK